MGVVYLKKLLRVFMTRTSMSSIPEGRVVGVDASAVIHAMLRRCMTEILVQVDWSGFAVHVEEMGRALLAAVSDDPGRVKFALDGKRLHAKLENDARSVKRVAARKRVGEALDSGMEPSKREKQVAIGAMAIKAGEIVYQVLTGLRIEVVVAPTESEHQLCLLQELEVINIVYANDIDYVNLGCDNILYPEKEGMFGPLLLYAKDNHFKYSVEDYDQLREQQETFSEERGGSKHHIMFPQEFLQASLRQGREERGGTVAVPGAHPENPFVFQCPGRNRLRISQAHRARTGTNHNLRNSR